MFHDGSGDVFLDADVDETAEPGDDWLDTIDDFDDNLSEQIERIEEARFLEDGTFSVALQRCLPYGVSDVVDGDIGDGAGDDIVGDIVDPIILTPASVKHRLRAACTNHAFDNVCYP